MARYVSCDMKGCNNQVDLWNEVREKFKLIGWKFEVRQNKVGGKVMKSSSVITCPECRLRKLEESLTALTQNKSGVKR